ncbi:MAG: molybdopterin dinucleotide binding domain-containing protein, partial [Oleibacter sp.]|nr:molybdopterin dinucleotide binding domain-containing protein [Thalassolituus sp.]
TDTTKAAHVLLPAASWGEKNGTVTNSERCISRQRSFLPPPGEAKPDWWIITQVAHHLGYEDAFPYQHPSEIFAEHVALSAFENNGSRDFDLSGLQGINQAEYDALAPIQWPINSSYPKGRARFYDDNHFYTPSGKANFIPVIATLPSELTDSQLLMNTGRIRDHWHTMTRTGKSARLAQHISEPYADMHSADAKKYNINDGDLIKVSNLRGNIIVRAKVHNDQTQRIGEIFVPMHWTSRYASLARMGSLIDKTNDPISGQPALKQTAVSIAPYAPQWQGFVLSKTDLGAPDCEYWAYNLTPYGHVYDVAGQQSAAEFINRISCDMDQGEWLRMSDAATNHYRLAHLIDGCLERLVFIHQDKKLPTRQWLTELFAKDTLTLEERKALLAGSLPGAKEDTGRIICSCFQVGEKTIINAIESGCDSASVLGEQLKCGTNCGSCIPELKSLLTAHVELET